MHIFLYLLISASLLWAQEAHEPGASSNWPSFRGPHAAGVADGQDLPDSWGGETMENIKWKTRIPGLAHSSPIVWGDRIYVTTAVSSQGDATFKHGLYGSGDASKDQSVHKWEVLCLNKNSGELIWQETADESVPKDKRHIKSTYANSTPVTDGRYVVAFFGSQGVFAFDLNGNLLWQKDLGRLDVGAYDAPTYEWGPASSPLIYRDLVILQCDTQNESFLIACDIKTGETKWRTSRDELPSWGTPTIYPGKSRVELITNSSNFIYGYEPLTGKELWRLGGSSKITAPTPVFKDSVIIVASGRRPEKPIFAIRPGGAGDISPADGESTSEFVLWSKTRVGPYMPTPLIYDKHLYVLLNQGILGCYLLASGEEVYRERIPHSGGGFSASPVAADDKLYLPGEDGEIYVVKTGPAFEVLAVNDMQELLMATPALSEGMLYVRGKDHLFAIGK